MNNQNNPNKDVSISKAMYCNERAEKLAYYKNISKEEALILAEKEWDRKHNKQLTLPRMNSWGS